MPINCFTFAGLALSRKDSLNVAAVLSSSSEPWQASLGASAVIAGKPLSSSLSTNGARGAVPPLRLAPSSLNMPALAASASLRLIARGRIVRWASRPAIPSSICRRMLKLRH